MVPTADARCAEMPISRSRSFTFSPFSRPNTNHLNSQGLSRRYSSITCCTPRRLLAPSQLAKLIAWPSTLETRCPEIACHVTTPVDPAIYEFPQNFAPRCLAISFLHLRTRSVSSRDGSPPYDSSTRLFLRLLLAVFLQL
jgi:hypothetical protein